MKLGAAEAEVEAEPEHLKEAIDMLPELLEILPSQPAQRQEQPAPPAQHETKLPEAAASVPSVTIEKGDSLADVIGKFFADKWGRERRKLSDVREALQSYGLNYPKQSVAVALLRLAKSGRIRRFKAEDGEYVYTSSYPLAPEPQPQGTLELPS